MITIGTKSLVCMSQTIFWVLFMVIDAYLLIPSILIRYIIRVKSERGSSSRTPKTVVIVGGNFAGLAALRELQHNPLFRVILIDQRDYFEYTPGILRAFCDPAAIHKLIHPFPHGSHQIIQGTVTKITTATTTTGVNHSMNLVTYVVDGGSGPTQRQQSHTIPFDYLILATGSTYTHPITASKTEGTISARAQGWQTWAQRVKAASSILILGGGAVGTEFAAEIAAHYNTDNNNNNNHNKSITLVDASPKLVPLFAQPVSDYAETWLKSHGVNLVLGQMLESWNTTGCTLKNGKHITADLVFVCFGDKPNSSPLVASTTKNKSYAAAAKKSRSSTTAITTTNSTSSSPPPAVVQLDKRKCIKVDAFLRAEGQRNVFCCGDVATPPTEGVKHAFHAEVQGHIAGNNVLRLATGRPFVRYPEDAAASSSGTSWLPSGGGNNNNSASASSSHLMPMVYVLSLGPWDGVIGFNSLTFPGPLAALLKWIIEWTKIRQMLGRPIGILVWMIGDAVTFFLSENVLPPVQKKHL